MEGIHKLIFLALIWIFLITNIVDAQDQQGILRLYNPLHVYFSFFFFFFCCFFDPNQCSLTLQTLVCLYILWNLYTCIFAQDII